MKRDNRRLGLFRSMLHVLINEKGMNVWDARMYARRVLNHPCPEPWENKRRSVEHSSIRKARLMQYIPTLEDLLELDFNGIVLDLRSIISGTLTPRPWCDISSTWLVEEHVNKGHYRPEPQYRLNAQERRDIRKMTRLLVSSGVPPLEAHQRAIQLLKSEGE